jgi:hypothetical protein
LDTAQGQALAAAFRSHPVGKLGAVRAVEHQPQGAEQVAVLDYPV